MSKPHRDACEVSSAREGESVAYIPPSGLLIAESSVPKESHGEPAQNSGKTILLYLCIVFFSLFYFRD